MGDDGLDADTVVVVLGAGQLNDHEAVLAEDGLQIRQVGGQAGELGLEVRIVVIRNDVLGLIVYLAKGDVQFGEVGLNRCVFHRF